MTTTRAVATVGDNCVDEYLDDDPQVAPASYVGGNAVNVAVGLAGLGRPTSYFGAVGDDGAGLRVRTNVAATGVDIEHVRTVRGGATGRTRIRRLPDGDRVFETEEFGTSAGYVPDVADVKALRECAAAHLGLLGDPGLVRRLLVDAGVLVSQDCSVAETVSELDIAFCSEEMAGDAAGAARRAVGQGARLCVVTRGSLGSLAHDGTQWWECPAERIDAVDTTGAGDSFIAGFLDTYLERRDVDAALRAATREAARTCLHLGAW